MLLDAESRHCASLRANLCWPPFLETGSYASTGRVLLHISAGPCSKGAEPAGPAGDVADALPPAAALLVVRGSEAVAAQDMGVLVPGTSQTVR